MSLRLPGDISDFDQLWRALVAGDDFVTQIDESRGLSMSFNTRGAPSPAAALPLMQVC